MGRKPISSAVLQSNCGETSHQSINWNAGNKENQRWQQQGTAKRYHLSRNTEEIPVVNLRCAKAEKSCWEHSNLCDKETKNGKLFNWKITTNLQSCVVYHIKCSGCTSTWVGQIEHYLATRHIDHCWPSGHLGSYLIDCRHYTEFPSIKVFGKSNFPTKLLTPEDFLISKLQHCINEKEQLVSRELSTSVS